MLKSIAILLSDSVRGGAFGDAHQAHNPAHSPSHRAIANLTTTTTTFPTKFLKARRGGGNLLGVNELRSSIEIGARGKKFDLVWFIRDVSRPGRVNGIIQDPAWESRRCEGAEDRGKETSKSFVANRLEHLHRVHGSCDIVDAQDLGGDLRHCVARHRDGAGGGVGHGFSGDLADKAFP
jgi:hypothetical protein